MKLIHKNSIRFILFGNAYLVVFCGIGCLLFYAYYADMHPAYTICPFMNLTALPCPLCGSVRAVCECVRGDWLTALRYNPFAVILFFGGIGIVCLRFLPLRLRFIVHKWVLFHLCLLQYLMVAFCSAWMLWGTFRIYCAVVAPGDYHFLFPVHLFKV